ncbi:MAG: OmpA family protein [Pseudomonadales bacterium]|nr:OmpA family protein [Pseudomonadales bacterium]
MKISTFHFKYTIVFVASLLLSCTLMALPSEADFSHVGGVANSASYDHNSATESTLSLTADRQVVHFNGSGFNLASSEIFNASYSGSDLAQTSSVLIEDVSGSPSAIYGLMRGNTQVYFINQNGVFFGNGSSVDLPGLVVSTLALSASDFDASNFNFTNNGLGSGITIEGLSSVNDVSFISDQITIDGEVNVSNGSFHAVAGENVVVSYDSNNLIQFDITEAIDATDPDGVIHVTANGQIIAQDVNLSARVLDPYSLAINNQGLIRATGLDTSTPGVIRLVGHGGKMNVDGDLDAVNGSVELSAGRIRLLGNIVANNIQAAIGFGANVGELDLFEISNFQVQSMDILGLGQLNKVYGLANIQVTGLNSGTAGLDGVGTSTNNWTENAVVFSNVHYFKLTGKVTNNVNVLAGGSLNTEYNGRLAGHIIGGGNIDNFNIDGEVAFINGGFNVNTLSGVFNPNDGVSDNVTTWQNIDIVTPGVIVPDSVIVPRNSTNAITDSSSSSLGLVGSDQSLKLPCAYRDNSEAKDDEDCNEAELEALVSSLIHFDFNSSAITSASQDRLNRVASFILQDDRFDRVVLSGHTDNLGTIAYNLALSARRTTSTAAYLKGQGVAPSLFEIHAFGESLPARSNATGAGRAYNRRVHVELE